MRKFQSTLPTRGSDFFFYLLALRHYVSIHAPHEGERQLFSRFSIFFNRFQSTLPTRGSDGHHHTAVSSASRFQSTLPTRGSDCFSFHGFALLLRFQSTLPTRGSDHSQKLHHRQSNHVSIHAPHEGERLAQPIKLVFCSRFQSTLPTRGSD